MTQTPEHPDDEFRDAGRPDFEVPDDPSALADAGAAPHEPTADEQADQGEAGELARQLADRTADLQRLQAEYVNYKRRVDRDRDLARSKGVESVVRDLLPVLDAIDAAKQHEELDGGFKLVVDALESVTSRYGLVSYGEVGEPFDPTLHEALMQVPMEGDHTTTVVSSVMQKGIKLGDRIVRAARVGVADPN